MVRALLIEIPIQFIRNLPRIKIEFDDVIDETNLNKLVHIKLTNRDNPTNELSSWYFTHCLWLYLGSRSSRYFSASSAAMQPKPADVIA